MPCVCCKPARNVPRAVMKKSLQALGSVFPGEYPNLREVIGALLDPAPGRRGDLVAARSELGALSRRVDYLLGPGAGAAKTIQGGLNVLRRGREVMQAALARLARRGP